MQRDNFKNNSNTTNTLSKHFISKNKKSPNMVLKLARQHTTILAPNYLQGVSSSSFHVTSLPKGS